MAFKSGQSGNPKGWPVGQTPQSIVRREIEKAVPEILAATIELAKSGDLQAVKILMDKACPSIRPQALSVRPYWRNPVPDRK